MDEQITPLVMCVDDDELTLELMSRYLQLQGIEVVKATSGIAALNLLAKLGTKWSSREVKVQYFPLE